MMKWGRLIDSPSQRPILGKRLALPDNSCCSGRARRLPIFRSFEPVASEPLRVTRHRWVWRLAALSSSNSTFKLTERTLSRKSDSVARQLNLLALGGSLVTSRKINSALVIAAVLSFLLSGGLYLQAAASYSLSFTYCTEPGTSNAESLRCQAALWYGYGFWSFLLLGIALTIIAIVRGRRQRVAAP
jgi:hypothetical protein